ncbi:SapC family protein [Pseudomonas sp. 21LCFQ010]|uniref:SapC family protein n=1 Tax=Pseudomonas sp. 21LCFQ010 TaxID=2957506 RepID=UPI00209713E4|nr:SapC family protein [Pseudomonas sp. 21LCFQ010]MCO8164184.1 SapC family protein [Pseudomonas sp. 21LCFQ010]
MPSYIPVSHSLLGDKRWRPHPSLVFAKADNVTPLLVSEVTMAAETLPIGFIKIDDQFSMVVLMGIRSGENLLVSESHQWIGEYMPVAYRSSPFDLRLLDNESGQQALCVDESCITEADDPQGYPFFTAEGEVAEATAKAFAQVQQFYTSRPLTNLISAKLAEHNLLTPWPLGVEVDGEQIAVNGLYQINEKALNQLPDAAFLELRQCYALPVAYAQLLSMSKIKFLAALLQQRKRTAEVPASGGSETFSFAGL